MCVCVHVCAVHVYAYIFKHIHTHMCVCVCVCACKHTHTHTHVCVCVCVCVCVRACVLMCVCVCVHTHMCCLCLSCLVSKVDSDAATHILHTNIHTNTPPTHIHAPTHKKLVLLSFTQRAGSADCPMTLLISYRRVHEAMLDDKTHPRDDTPRYRDVVKFPGIVDFVYARTPRETTAYIDGLRQPPWWHRPKNSGCSSCANPTASHSA